MAISELLKSYESFAGVNISAVLAGTAFGEIQGISYSITREKAPIYTMGSTDPRSFARGKRAIAGSLMFIMFDRNALLHIFNQKGLIDNKYRIVVSKDTIRPISGDLQEFANSDADSAIGVQSAIDNANTNTNFLGSTVDSFNDYESVSPWYTDQIPPFNIVLLAVNELGHQAKMEVFGVEILNEGYAISVDEMSSELQTTYIARMIFPWTFVGNKRSDSLSNASTLTLN